MDPRRGSSDRGAVALERIGVQTPAPAPAILRRRFLLSPCSGLSSRKTLSFRRENRIKLRLPEKGEAEPVQEHRISHQLVRDLELRHAEAGR